MIEILRRGDQASELYFIGQTKRRDVRRTQWAHITGHQHLAEMVMLVLLPSSALFLWWILSITDASTVVARLVAISALTVTALAVASVVHLFWRYPGRDLLDNRAHVVRTYDVSYRALAEQWDNIYDTGLATMQYELSGKHTSSDNERRRSRFVLIKTVLDRYFIFTQEIDIACRGRAPSDIIPDEIREEARRVFDEVMEICAKFEKYEHEQENHHQEINRIQREHQSTAIDHQNSLALRRFQKNARGKQATRS